MAVLYSNNASTTLSASITNSATSLTVAAGKGALFPAISGSDYFYITLVSASGVIEIMKVTARSADVFTVTRGQDGTTAVAWAAGDRVELRFNKALLDDVKSALVSAVTSADWNVANPNVAQLISTSTNGVNGVTNYVGMHFPHASLNYGFQIAGRNDSAYYRTLENNTYTAWRAIAHSATQLYTFPVLDNNLNLDSGQQDKVWATNIGTATDRGTKPANYAFVVNLGGRAASGLQIAASYGGSDNFFVRRGSDNGGSVNGANAWQPWYTLLHSGNYSSYAAAASHTHSYLPLSGGALTGNITFGNFLKIAQDNTDWSNGNYFRGSTDHFVLGVQSGGTLYLNYGNEAGTTRISGTTLVNGNQVLHAGNFSSYALPNPGSGTGGRVLVNLSGNPSWSDASFTYDPIMGQFRATNFRANVGDAAPTWNFNAILHAGNYTDYTEGRYLRRYDGDSGSFDLNVSGAHAWVRFSQGAWGNNPYPGNYSHVLSFNAASDNRTSQIYIGDVPGAMYVRRSQGGAGTWHPWEKVLTSYNWSDYAAPVSHTHNYVLKTGDTMTGRLTIDGSGWTTNNRNYSNEWIEFPNYSGLYSPNNGAHFYPNSGTYGSWYVSGSRNGWSGLEFQASNGNVQLMIDPNSNTSGFHNNSYGWQFRWNNGTAYVYKNAYGGGTAATVLDSSNYTNYTPVKVAGSAGYPHAGTGMFPFYNWGGSNGGTSAPSDNSYTIGISVGSHPSDQAYGFQIARNMWNTGLWTRGYDSGWGGWVRLLDSANYTDYGDGRYVRKTGDTMTGTLTVGRDVIVNGQTGGNYGNRIVVGASDTSYTMQDTNLRPTIQANGQYPVLSLNHTITSNSNHGPTIQMTANGVGNQFVIGMTGNGSALDMGYSSATDWNPHNGIAGYNGVTFFRATSGGFMGLGAPGDWGPLGAGDPAYHLHVKGYPTFNQGYAGVFQNTGGSNGGGWLFQNDAGNHSWGATAEFRINGTGDRPSVIFSSAAVNTSWSVGFVTGSDDTFRITKNHGHRAFYNGWADNNNGWGTAYFYITSSGVASANGGTLLSSANYTNYTSQYVLKSGDTMTGGLVAPGVDTNYADSAGWASGTASATGYFGGPFIVNGSDSENTRLFTDTPFFSPGLIWAATNNDSASDGDGGWDKLITGLSHTKTYRSVVWVRRTTSSTNGQFYHGCDSGGATLNLNGTTNYNPYFSSFGIVNLVQGRWYLSVGYIHAYGDGSTSSYGGLWDTVTGTRVINYTDYKMAYLATQQVHRTYLYYSTDSAARLEWWSPRFEEVDGNEPSINSMLLGATTVLTVNNYSNHVLPLSGGVVNGSGYFRKSQTAGDYTTASLWTESYSNTATGIAFHISGVVGKFLEMRTNGTLYWNSDTVIHSGNYSSYSLPLSGGTLTGSLVNNQDGGVIVESNASEYNNWLFKEAVKQWGIFYFNKGSQSGQTIGGYTTIGAETFYMGGGSGIDMPSGWTGYQSGSKIAAMISHYTGYIYSASTVYAASSMSVGGSTVLHAGNYSSYALPLSGGTLASTNDGILTLNKSSGTGWGYINFSQAGTRRFYFGLNASFEPELGTDNGGTFRVIGNMTVGGNQVLHAGNISSYAGADTGAKGNIQIFNASGTFTVPAGITKLRITAFGGGGGGASAYGWAGGSGGAGIAIVTVTPGTSYTVTIGAGGRGAGWTGGSLAGGTTSFGSLVTATGGLGSVWNTVSPTMGSFTTTGTLIASIKATAGNLSLWGGADGATSYSFVGAGGGGMHGGGGSAGTAGGNSIYGAKGNNGGSSPTTSNGGAGGSVSGGAAGGAGGVYGTDGYGVAYGAGGGGAGGMIIEW